MNHARQGHLHPAARLRRIGFLLLTFPFVAGCSERMPEGIVMAPPSSHETAMSVTGTAASALGADGKFHLVSLPTFSSTEISDARARELAEVWAHEFGPHLKSYLETQHGAAIRYDALASCGRTLYARSAFLPVSDKVPAPYARPYGSWWLVTLCEAGGLPAVSVAVSALATELSVVNGNLRFPMMAGNEFFPIGIPAGSVGEFPVSPETATALAAQQTGRRTTLVPELVMPVNTDGPPQAARWRLTLESPANVRTAALGALSTRELFVGLRSVTSRGLVHFVASPAQDAGVKLRWSPGPNPGESVTAYAARMDAELATTAVLRRADTPTRFESALPGGQ
jgi:hypothetical protein